jgi:type VI secretion system protein ImpF
MTDLTPQERLQPSLLDRLTDADPTNKTEPRERRVLSMQRLREGVLRDLRWLLNTGHLETVESLEAYPRARVSVLNYGLPDLSGANVVSMDAAHVERLVREAITKYEPRINPKTLKVTVKVDRELMNQNALTFQIEGELWAQPTPMALFLKTVLDMESGDVEIPDR